VPAQELETSRVLLRHWREEDFLPWAELNADPLTMRYFPRLLQPEESKQSLERIRSFLASHDFGLWAAEEKSSGQFMGFIGITRTNIPTLPTPECNEIGWRLDKRFWGKGYATEAATEVRSYVQDKLNMNEIYSMTSTLNIPSINVMRKIGLHERPELDFLNPRVPEENPLRPHVVYSSQAAFEN
jgi:ribosomal-protein-alanine N-acetyltransferase